MLIRDSRQFLKWSNKPGCTQITETIRKSLKKQILSSCDVFPVILNNWNSQKNNTHHTWTHMKTTEKDTAHPKKHMKRHQTENTTESDVFLMLVFLIRVLFFKKKRKRFIANAKTIQASQPCGIHLGTQSMAATYIFVHCFFSWEERGETNSQESFFVYFPQLQR